MHRANIALRPLYNQPHIKLLLKIIEEIGNEIFRVRTRENDDKWRDNNSIAPTDSTFAQSLLHNQECQIANEISSFAKFSLVLKSLLPEIAECAHAATQTFQAAHGAHHFAHAAFLELLHHALHLFKLLQQLVHFLNRYTGTRCNTTLA